jgi:hypothetical protein
VNARQWRDRANGPLDLRGMNIRRISVDTTGHGATVLKRGVVEWEEVWRFVLTRIRPR